MATPDAGDSLRPGAGNAHFVMAHQTDRSRSTGGSQLPLKGWETRVGMRGRHSLRFRRTQAEADRAPGRGPGRAPIGIPTIAQTPASFAQPVLINSRHRSEIVSSYTPVGRESF